MLYAARKALWDWAVKNLNPDPPKIRKKPEVGHIRLDDVSMEGSFDGAVALPFEPDITDMAALALMMTASWSSNVAPSEGLHGKINGTAFRYKVNWTVEFEKVDPESDGLMMLDPTGIRAFIDAALEYSGEYDDDDYDDAFEERDREECDTSQAISFEEARNRLREVVEE